MKVFARAACVLVLLAVPCALYAQSDNGLVLDQTGLPLPGATVQLFEGSRLISLVSTDGEGRFAFDRSLPGETIAVSLNGFESARLPRHEAVRVVLWLVRATDETRVVAPTVSPSSPLTPLLGNTLTATNIARLPSAKLKARESLPLLPSVVRGPDGLMQLGGARAHETPLFLDGFNVSDPATGISSLNLPFEAVQGVDVLRDPMAVTFGGLLGGLVALESRPGGPRFAAGVQGFVPRPRFSTPGFGRLEGIFPRAYVSGASETGRFRYVIAAEYDYERIPVPGVTAGQGPDIIQESSITFARFDLEPTPHHHLTFEGLVFPGDTRSLGLSPRRTADATTDLNERDLFAGLIDHFVPDSRNVFTLQVGVLEHEATVQPLGAGTSALSYEGWSRNWFTHAGRTSGRVSASASWERIATVGSTSHDVTVSTEVTTRHLNGRVEETSIVVNDAQGRPVRSIDFDAGSTVRANDRPIAAAFRDVWQLSDRAQIDGGVRLDHSRYGGGTPSGRVGVRYELDGSGFTVLKAGYGSFVGSLPLAVPAFGGYPGRVDRFLDPVNGDVLSAVSLRPSVRSLRAPRSVAATVALERQLFPGLDAQVSMTNRQSSRLATLEVPTSSGDLVAASDGTGWYREAQVSVRRVWPHDQQLFVSYVRSAAHGELNDFETLYQSLDAPLLQRGGRSKLPGDAPNRLLAWGTFNLPARFVVSPVAEWRSGFPYSVVDERYLYSGTPNSQRFPTFFATDMVIYKTVTVGERSADFGIQIFNVTNHRNPRDVYPVAGAPRSGEFTNSVGPIVRGYLLLKW